MNEQHNSSDHMEIERKWLVNGWPEPELPLLDVQQMRQGYISVHPTVRIREERTAGGPPSYILCFKSGGKLVRREIEISLEEDTFHELESLIGLPLIPKERRTYLLPDGLHLEVNLVDADSSTSFWYAEVEFPSVEEADAWRPEPSLSAYLCSEVTQEKGYSMGAYWKRTRMA